MYGMREMLVQHEAVGAMAIPLDKKHKLLFMDLSFLETGFTVSPHHPGQG